MTAPSAGTLRCACGCERSEHATVVDLDDEGQPIGERPGRCRTCGWRKCGQFEALTLDAQLAALAAETGESIETVRELWEAMQACAEETAIEERVERAQAEAGEVLDQWDAWDCPDCGRRYRQYGDHGAPTRCGGELVPVTVTITRRAT